MEGKTYIRPANHVYCGVMCLDESLVFKHFIGKIDAVNAFNKDITQYNRANSELANFLFEFNAKKIYLPGRRA